MFPLVQHRVQCVSTLVRTAVRILCYTFYFRWERSGCKGARNVCGNCVFRCGLHLSGGYNSLSSNGERFLCTYPSSPPSLHWLYLFRALCSFLLSPVFLFSSCCGNVFAARRSVNYIHCVWQLQFRSRTFLSSLFIAENL
jgi:hypothetical protein